MGHVYTLCEKETGGVTAHGVLQRASMELSVRGIGRYYILLHICDLPYKKVIICSEVGKWTCCGVASVQQHVEPARTEKGDFKCLSVLM